MTQGAEISSRLFKGLNLWHVVIFAGMIIAYFQMSSTFQEHVRLKEIETEKKLTKIEASVETLQNRDAAIDSKLGRLDEKMQNVATVLARIEERFYNSYKSRQ